MNNLSIAIIVMAFNPDEYIGEFLVHHGKITVGKVFSSNTVRHRCTEQEHVLAAAEIRGSC